MSERASTSSRGTIGDRRIRQRRAVPGDDIQADAIAEPRHLPADAADADQAERLALELHALHDAPAAAAHHVMHRADVAGGREDEAHGVLGNGRVAIALDGRDLDAQPLGGGEIDEAAGAGAEKDDVLQAGAGLAASFP